MRLLKSSKPSGLGAVRPLPDLPIDAVLGAIFNSIDQAVLLTDLEGRGLACNARFESIFGMTPEETVNMSHVEMRNRIADQVVDVPAWRSRLETIDAADGERFEDDVLYHGGDLILRRVVSPVSDQEGRLIGRLWTYRDVTEAAQRLRNQDLLRKITALTDPDPVVVLEAICDAVSRHFGETVAKITILEGDFLRFHVVAGDLGPAKGLSGILANDTYCGITLGKNQTFVVQDARTNECYSQLLPATVNYARYLGVPVRNETGRPIGTLCIVDQQMDRILTPVDVELLETVALRVNAELARERYLAERIAERDRRHAARRRELDETRVVLESMNDAFSFLFAAQDTPDLLRRHAASLRGLLGYTASAVWIRRTGGSVYEVAAWPANSESVQSFVAPVDDYPALLRRQDDEVTRDVGIVPVEGTSVGRLLGLPWAAIACLPAGEGGEAIVVLGRSDEPPADDRHRVLLSAITEGVRLVLAAHVLNEEIAQANQALVTAQERALASEKLAVVGTLAASTAHDIRNIVASLAMLVAQDHDPKAALSAVREQLDRFSVLAHRLLSYARPGQVARHSVDLDELLERVLALTAGQRRVSRVKASLETPEGRLFVSGDSGQLQHLFVNLVLNAIQAMDREGGNLRISVRPSEESVEIRVSDDGPGIPPVIADRLFEPFASSRPQGFGLGLFSARRIVEDHGGEIVLEPVEGSGATFVVRLPRVDEVVF